MTKKISILGCTGSIGLSTLEIVEKHPDRFEVVGLAAGKNIDLLANQIRCFKPRLVSVQSPREVDSLKTMLGQNSLEIGWGAGGAQAVAAMDEADMVVSAIVGAQGLLPTLKALAKGKVVGLANKESMVIAGELMSQEANKSRGKILPIDSEHSALAQCLEGHRKVDVKRLILTASGGPFFNKPAQAFSSITVDEALKHPNWSMGPKITIDSATLMNKGLEVMEARWLFEVPIDRIDICIHPQSIIHSMVEYIDGSVIAQMGVPDMKVPIAYAMSYPERIETGTTPLNLFAKRELTFFEPDFEKFPCLKMAYDVGRKGQTYPAVLNAANEVVVDSFLKKRISFPEIPRILSKIIEVHEPRPVDGLEDILEADRWAREMALRIAGT